jgi:hypothetical protein
MSETDSRASAEIKAEVEEVLRVTVQSLIVKGSIDGRFSDSQ